MTLELLISVIEPSWISTAFAAFAGVAVLRYLVGLLTRPGNKPVAWYCNKGAERRWAVVTGATDGIGRGFVEALLARDIAVCMVSRSEEKLERVKGELQKKWPEARLRTIAMDFSDLTASRWADLSSSLPADIGCLINNVGVNSAVPERLEDMDEGDIERMIDVNVKATTRLTRMVLQRLKAQDASRFLCITLSSFSAHQPAPLMAVYAATKAYDEVFSRALSAECADRPGYTFLAITPAFVVSQMSGARKSSFFVASARTVADNALGASGTASTVTPYFPHWLQDTVLALMPWKLREGMMLKTMKQGRAKILRRLAKQK